MNPEPTEQLAGLASAIGREDRVRVLGMNRFWPVGWFIGLIPSGTLSTSEPLCNTGVQLPCAFRRVQLAL